MGQPARKSDAPHAKVDEATSRKRLDPLIVAKWRTVFDTFSPKQKEMLEDFGSDSETS